MKKVERISQAELENVGRSMPIQRTQLRTVPVAINANSNTFFMNKLKPQEIEEYFGKFGFVNMALLSSDGCELDPSNPNANPDYIAVTCNDFLAAFNDYDCYVGFFDEDSLKKSAMQGTFDTTLASDTSFDAKAFFTYCDIAGISPEHAISQMIATEFLAQRFPNYTRRREEVKNKTLAGAYKQLPKAMQTTLKGLQEERENQIKSLSNKGTYGSFNIEDYIMRTHIG